MFVQISQISTVSTAEDKKLILLEHHDWFRGRSLLAMCIYRAKLVAVGNSVW